LPAVQIAFRDTWTGEDIEEAAFSCQDPNCYRRYSPLRGYFSYAKVGEHPNFGDSLRAQYCVHNNKPIYMFLKSVDKELVWVCPECGFTKAFKI
jgi:rubrerythrin